MHADGQSVLLIAPTGGGKTLAGFLPSLVELAHRPVRKESTPSRLHTLYISPLKALAVDVARNLEMPVKEIGLDIKVETRTGDTPSNRRQRQRRFPPDILMTTPEQLALLLAYPGAAQFFEHLHYVILDELHALANTKRGELLSLGLGRLARYAPTHRRIGLSATVADPDYLRRYLVPQGPLSGTQSAIGSTEDRLASLVVGQAGARPELTILASNALYPVVGSQRASCLG